MPEGSLFQLAYSGNSAADALDDLPLPYLELDAHGVVVRANRATYALHPVDHGELIGRSAWDSMPPGEKEQSCAAYMQLLETGAEPQTVHRHIFDKSGEFRIYKMYRRFIRDEAGKPIGMRVISVDVTETTNALEETRRERQWLEHMVACMPAAVIVTDTVGMVTYLNAAAEELLSWMASEAIGTEVEKILPLLEYSATDGVMLDHGAALEKPTCGTATTADRQGRQLRVEIRTAPMVNKQTGVTIGVTGFVRRLSVA
jgi:PAS domain S-box-containing protein